jgi:hypothetical protein
MWFDVWLTMQYAGHQEDSKKLVYCSTAIVGFGIRGRWVVITLRWWLMMVQGAEVAQQEVLDVFSRAVD